MDSSAEEPFRFPLDDERVAARRELDRLAVTYTMKDAWRGLVIIRAAAPSVGMKDTREKEVANENTAYYHGNDL